MAENENVKVGTDWMEVEIMSEPYVVMTFRGYEPVVDVQTGGAKKRLFIGPKSLGQALEPSVRKSGKFAGLRFRVKKESGDRMAPYVVEMV
ncbi:MAG: hypothetical protein HYY16_15440 [Planctomycetes bacterium]|nr:hypothetical protein [Planctomycetota bacterium]